MKTRFWVNLAPAWLVGLIVGMVVVGTLTTCRQRQPASQADVEKDKRIAWWREARFGMFIHFGISTVTDGAWKGKRIDGSDGWIMRQARIPVKEYEQIAKQFNPVKFNADEWVRIAKDAGMKYIVYTSKRHDGFGMYDSKVSDYDIPDATPFKRDPVKELAEACQKEGIKLCFYYSHAQDWHHPGGAGNNWDYLDEREYPEENKREFARYFEEKAKPQVRELLTQYGPVGIMWFDTPQLITKEQSEELVALVRQLQPNCIINNRAGHGLGDYNTPEQRIPSQKMPTFEVCMTMNDTWGFKPYDHNWKSTKQLLHNLVDIASKGGNYLLNVGPTAEGIIPPASVRVLQEIGKWMDKNGECIYGTTASPFMYQPPWGAITSKPGKLFLCVFEWPRSRRGRGGRISIGGLEKEVMKAYLLADKEKKALEFVQNYIEEYEGYWLDISVPAEAPDENVSVVVLETKG